MVRRDAFWDTSALVPLFVVEPTSTRANELSVSYAQVVWWATEVEVHSAVSRLQRMGAISNPERQTGLSKLSSLKDSWQVVEPSMMIRDRARNLLAAYPLRAADSLQLAAALVWCDFEPANRKFLTADVRLSEAAAAEGFDVILLC